MATGQGEVAAFIAAMDGGLEMLDQIDQTIINWYKIVKLR